MNVVAGSVYGGVMFDLTDGKVASIFIGAADGKNGEVHQICGST